MLRCGQAAFRPLRPCWRFGDATCYRQRVWSCKSLARRLLLTHHVLSEFEGAVVCHRAWRGSLANMQFRSVRSCWISRRLLFLPFDADGADRALFMAPKKNFVRSRLKDQEIARSIRGKSDGSGWEAMPFSRVFRFSENVVRRSRQSLPVRCIANRIQKPVIADGRYGSTVLPPQPGSEWVRKAPTEHQFSIHNLFI